ncbi:MAG TPA: hypothetical protein PLW09_03015 [Candidatus Kapabacteria bacterium]|jgi:hypothetical protein|nr:hypothetical protein [Candidatus Kapabacteria bacterium]
MNSNNYIAIVLMAIVAIASRLLPHPPNMTAVMAVALFAGARITNTKLAMALPLLIMILSDIFLGFHSSQLVVYVCILAVSVLGLSLRNSTSFTKPLAMSFIGSLFFFLVTNFAVWLGGAMYPMTLEGLFLCYAAALPFYTTDSFQFVNSSQLVFGSFFANGVIGDLFFTGVLFGLYELSKKFSTKAVTSVQ